MARNQAKVVRNVPKLTRVPKLCNVHQVVSTGGLSKAIILHPQFPRIENMMFTVKLDSELGASVSREERGTFPFDHRETQDHLLTRKGRLKLYSILTGQCVPATKTEHLLLLEDLEPPSLSLPCVKELVHPCGTRDRLETSDVENDCCRQFLHTPQHLMLGHPSEWTHPTRQRHVCSHSRGVLLFSSVSAEGQ